MNLRTPELHQLEKVESVIIIVEGDGEEGAHCLVAGEVAQALAVEPFHVVDGTAAAAGIAAFLLQFLCRPFKAWPPAAAVGAATCGDFREVLVAVHVDVDGAGVGASEDGAQYASRLKRCLQSDAVAGNLFHLYAVELAGVGVGVVEEILHITFGEETS